MNTTPATRSDVGEQRGRLDDFLPNRADAIATARKHHHGGDHEDQTQRHHLQRHHAAAGSMNCGREGDEQVGHVRVRDADDRGRARRRSQLDTSLTAWAEFEAAPPAFRIALMRGIN